MKEWGIDVNTGLLVVAILLGVLLYVESKGWSAPAMKAAIDKLFLEHGNFWRVQKTHELEMGALKRKIAAHEIRFSEVADRVTDVDEAISNKLHALSLQMESMTSMLSGLACSENNWHRGEKPGFCPLHQQECPLNGQKEEK